MDISEKKSELYPVVECRKMAFSMKKTSSISSFISMCNRVVEDCFLIHQFSWKEELIEVFFGLASIHERVKEASEMFYLGLLNAGVLAGVLAGDYCSISIERSEVVL